MQTKKIEYHHGNVLLEGFYAFDETLSGKRPAILIAHDWSGRGEFVEKKAEKLAKLGYLGFALDMYGKGKRATSKEEKVTLMKPFMDDRQLLLDRVVAAFDCLKGLDNVDTSRIGGMGYCFGGTCVFDLARHGADLRGVISFHGGLHAPKNVRSQPIKAKMLALHGYSDPMVPKEDVRAFEDEMTKAKADWQVYVYGDAMHAFTNPTANDIASGILYNKLADERSWIAMENFFAEVL